MSATAPEKPQTARDQLVEALADRLLAAGASLGVTVGVSAGIARWATDYGVADDALRALAERIAPPTQPQPEGANSDH